MSPTYPAAARAVRASGTVNVQVEVDSAGSVISAISAGGHPLLRTTAENSALTWSFAAVPGRHFLNLTFVFTAGKVGSKDKTKVHGPYKLELIAGSLTILQTTSY